MNNSVWMKLTSNFVSRLTATALAVGLTTSAFAVTPKRKTTKKAAVVKVITKAAPRAVPATATAKKRRVWVQTWDEPTYKDSTVGDVFEGEDPIVRRAAVEALGPLNGAVVVVDPESGRVLSMVNQHLALGGGFQPCSTIKIPDRR